MTITCDLCTTNCRTFHKWLKHLISPGHQATAASQISTWTLNQELALDPTSPFTIFVIRPTAEISGEIPSVRTMITPWETLTRFWKHGFVHNFYFGFNHSCSFVQLELSTGTLSKTVQDDILFSNHVVKEIQQTKVMEEFWSLWSFAQPNTSPTKIKPKSSGDTNGELTDNDCECDTVQPHVIPSKGDSRIQKIVEAEPTTRKHIVVDSKPPDVVSKVNTVGDVVVTTAKLDDLEIFFKSVTLSQPEIESRKVILKSLTELIRAEFKSCRLMEYGSFLTKLGDSRSGLNLSLIGYDNVKIGPAAQSCSKPSVEGYVATRVLDLVRTSGAYKTIQLLQHFPTKDSHAVTFLHKETEVSCRVTFRNLLGLRTSELIKTLTKFDPRVYNLMLLVRYWRKLYHVPGSVTLTNYTLSLLVVVFLGRKKILPTIHQLQAAAPAQEVNGWNCGFCGSFPTIRKLIDDSRTNQEAKYDETVTVGQLLRDFFVMISNENFHTQIICTLTAESVPITAFRPNVTPTADTEAPFKILKLLPQPPVNYNFQHNYCNIQDPFYLENNLGYFLYPRELDEMKISFQETADHLSALLNQYAEKDLTVAQLFPQDQFRRIRNDLSVLDHRKSSANQDISGRSFKISKVSLPKAETVAMVLPQPQPVKIGNSVISAIYEATAAELAATNSHNEEVVAIDSAASVEATVTDAVNQNINSCQSMPPAIRLTTSPFVKGLWPRSFTTALDDLLIEANKAGNTLKLLEATSKILKSNVTSAGTPVATEAPQSSSEDSTKVPIPGITSANIASLVRKWKRRHNCLLQALDALKLEATPTEVISASLQSQFKALRRCFYTELDLFLEQVTLSHADFQERSKFTSTLQTHLRRVWGLCQVREFGSTMTRLGDRMSDMDLSVVGCSTASNPVVSKHVIRKVAGVLASRSNIYRSVELIPKKSMPYLRFVHRPTGILCDLTFDNGLGVRNSKLIKFLTRFDLDPRVFKLMVLVRQWGKFYNLTASTKLKNYALNLLLLVFLARRKILPKIYQLQEIVPEEVTVDGWNGAFCQDIHLVRRLTDEGRTTSDVDIGTKSVLELYHDFFVMMASEDWYSNVICTLTAEAIPKTVFGSDAAMMAGLSDKFDRLKNFQVATGTGTRPKFRLSLINIQDPFCLQSNIGVSVTTIELFDRVVFLFGKTARYLTSLLATYTEEELSIAHLFPQDDHIAQEYLNGISLTLETMNTETERTDTTLPNEPSPSAATPSESKPSSTYRYSVEGIERGAFDRLERAIVPCTTFKYKEFKAAKRKILEGSHILECRVSKAYAQVFFDHDGLQGHVASVEREQVLFQQWHKFAKLLVNQLWSCYSFKRYSLGHLELDGPSQMYCSLVSCHGHTFRIKEVSPLTKGPNPLETESQCVTPLTGKNTKMAFKCLTILEVDPEIGPNLTLILTDLEGPTDKVKPTMNLISSRIPELFENHQRFLLNRWILQNQKD